MTDGGRETIGDESLENWKELGSGGFGCVYKANHKDWDFEVAIKLLHVGCGTLSTALGREAGYMDSAAFVPKVYGMYQGIPPVPDLGCIKRHGIVMELMERGSLLSLQKALSGPPPWPLAFRLANQVAVAMNFIHSKKPPVVHSDLKPGNVLLDANLNAKIADFGFSMVSTSVLNITNKGDEGGTPAYTAPEAFEQDNYRPVRSYDIYSYGILLWTILTGKEPYPAGVNRHVLPFRIIQGDRPDLHKIDQSKADGLEELVDLMERCWDKDPTKRPMFRGCTEVTRRVFSKHMKGINAAVYETMTKLDSVNRQEECVRPPGHATTKAATTEDRPPTKPGPQTDTPLPQTDKPVPQTDTLVPQTNKPVPQTDTPVPQTAKPLPQTDTLVPQTYIPVPQTDKPVPQTDSPSTTGRGSTDPATTALLHPTTAPRCTEVTGPVFSKHQTGINAAVNETLTKLDSVNRQEECVRPPGHAATKATEDRPPTKPVPQADTPGPMQTDSPSTTGRSSTDPATTALLHPTAAPKSPVNDSLPSVPPGSTNRKDYLKHFSHLTLNTNTAHSDLSLSRGNMVVTRGAWGCAGPPPPDHPDRFEYWDQVLCTEGLTGPCYWEVERNGGVDIAVTYGGISRKGHVNDCRLGYNDKSWSLVCYCNSYRVRHNRKTTDLPVRPSGSKRVAVYLDCPLGTLSFYEVCSDSLTHLYTFTFHNTFSEPLYAGFRLSPLSYSSVTLLY